ncbi:hypothetical protein B0I37DRAFT_119063 [Chaetomium sp. MPI-CAGE-AT-0009]|nr:hypothetical protein B0I37DRAFT_119063 [Chaetomium sp. MPI-CAGE-AT-0009]
MDNQGPSKASKPASTRQNAATTGTRTVSTGTATNTNVTAPAPRIITAEPRSRSVASATRPSASPLGMPTISSATLNAIVTKLAKALDGKSYAIVGGTALALLEIRGSVTSVDVFVPPGTTSKRIKTLCTTPSTNRFKWDPTTHKVWYVRESGGNDALIRFWEPKVLQQQFPNSSSDLIMVGEVPVLKPTLLLNIYCHNWLSCHLAGARDAEMADQAAADIDLLVKHIAKETKKEVSNATSEFLIKLGAAKPQVQAGFADLGIKLRN